MARSSSPSLGSMLDRRGGSRRRKTPFDIFSGTTWDERGGPFFAVALFGFLGQVFHWFWGQPPAAYLVVPMLVAAGVGAYPLVYAQAAGRKPLYRRHAAITASAAMVSVGLTTAWGLDVWIDASGSGAWLKASLWTHVYLLLGLLIGFSWVAPTFGSVSGYGDDTHSQPGDNPFESLTRQAAIKTQLVEDNGSRKSFRISHKGATHREIAATAEKLGSLAELPPGGIRMRPDPDKSSETLVDTVSEDLLRRPTDWPGPSRPGGSCAEPARVGVREDGGDLELLRVGDPDGARVSQSILIAGQTGSGKTEGEVCEVVEMSTRVDVLVWWMDSTKPWQTVPDFRPALDWLADTKPRVAAVARALDPVITARAGELGRLGYREWVPECWTKHGIPYIVAHLEEASEALDSLGTAFVRGAERVRSAGISISTSLQRPSASNMPTDLRSQFGIRWCFGVASEVDAGMTLNDATLDAGARPDAWGNTKPGYTYLEAAHVDSRFWSMPGRTFRLRPHIVAAAIAEWAPQMAVADPVTARAAGEAYANRERCDLDQWVAEAIERHGGKDPAHGELIREAFERGQAALQARTARGDWPGRVPEGLGPLVLGSGQGARTSVRLPGQDSEAQSTSQQTGQQTPQQDGEDRQDPTPSIYSRWSRRTDPDGFGEDMDTSAEWDTSVSDTEVVEEIGMSGEDLALLREAGPEDLGVSLTDLFQGEPREDFVVGSDPDEAEEFTAGERARAFVRMLSALRAETWEAGVASGAYPVDGDGTVEVTARTIKRRWRELPEGQVTPPWTYWRLDKMQVETPGSVERVLDADGNFAEPATYRLGPELDRAAAPDPESDPDSPANWSIEDFR